MKNSRLNRRLAVVFLGVLGTFAMVVSFAGCPPQNPCEGVNCSNHGFCQNVESEARCTCDPGWTGEACSECTWAGPGEPCEPESIRDLYDLAALKSMTLADLKWVVEEEYTTDEKVTVLVGSWSGGMFDTFDSDGNRRQIELQEKAALYLPPGYPETPNQGKGFVYAVHNASSVLKESGSPLCNVFRVPILYHGEKPVDWKSLGFASRGDLSQSSGTNLVTVNTCELVSLTRGNFGHILARTDSMAITLLQRVAEERGGTVDKVGLKGFSKEGAACWRASAVDDRIEVANPGGSHKEDKFYALRYQAESWGCEEGAPMAEKVKGGLMLLDWSENTPAGAVYAGVFSTENYKHLLYPRFVLINGDVTRYNMHDGGHFALGCESSFLERFTERPWRYDRKPNNRETALTTKLQALLIENLLAGPGAEDELYPKVVETGLQLDGVSILARARASSPTDAVRLWWSWSEDRVWNDRENAEWTPVEMNFNGDHWVSQWVDTGVPEEMVIGWYVEAENKATFEVPGGAPYHFKRRDTSPVEFARITAPLTCQVDPLDWCAE